MQIIHSALEAFWEDVLPPEALPRYDRSDEAGLPALSLAPNGGILEHEGTIVEPVLAPHTEAELENGAKFLMLRAARRVRAEDIYYHFADLDLPERHAFEIQEQIIFGGDDLERGDALLVIADPSFFGLVVRQGELSTVVIHNPLAIVRTDPLAAAYIRQRAVPPPPVFWENQGKRRERLRAERKSKALLFRSLTREQKWELRAHQRVTVKGQDGATYRIYKWQGMNVRLLEGAEETASLCIVPTAETPIPVYDLMLAQKVLLESQIDEFMKIAAVRRG